MNKWGVQIRKGGSTKNPKINKWVGGWGGDYYLELGSKVWKLGIDAKIISWAPSLQKND